MFSSCVSSVCSVLIPCFQLSVPVQSIACSGKTRLLNDLLCVKWDVKQFGFESRFKSTEGLSRYS